jgi:uncharacterized RDD family membrane protein YckC
VSELPSYPQEAAQREAAVIPAQPAQVYAGWGSRVAAYLLDALVLIAPLFLFFVVVIAANPYDNSGAWAALGLVYLASFVLPFVYFTVLHGRERGQTLGKRALGIKVVDDHGASIGYGRSFGRYAITFLFAIFILPVLLDYLWPLWDPRSQALHDKVAGSFVVRA